MRADPAFTLRQAEQVIATHAPQSLRQAIAKALRVATQFRTERVEDAELPIGASRFGGRPDLPVTIEWPQWNGFTAEDLVNARGMRIPQGQKAATLSFLAQLHLAEIPDGTGLLPDKGWLFFFYDAAQQPWGFDPRDRGCARVFYVDGDVASLQRRDIPAAADGMALHATKLTAELVATLPCWDFQLGLELDKAARDAFGKLVDEHMAGWDPHHRLLGWPKPIQGEMELECQLVTNGIYCGGPDGYGSEHAQRLKSGAVDWMLLLQIDSDEAGPGWMWGDAGCLYFWIRKQDLEARRFENAWAILQCY
ncbi:MAG TPA: YwqG family protein [Kofleriaceae bacterium]|nr:YwqG family protein [Kofleriaceae bacterium]